MARTISVNVTVIASVADQTGVDAIMASVKSSVDALRASGVKIDARAVVTQQDQAAL